MARLVKRIGVIALLIPLILTVASRSAGAQDADAPSIAELATDDGPGAGFTTLRLALAQTGLADKLGDCDSGDLFTMLAPTDDAFVNAAASGFDATAVSSDADAVAEIVRYHMIEGAIPAEAVAGLDGSSVTTVHGEEITIAIDGETISIGNGNPVAAEVIAADIQACNGVVHALDNVLVPPSVAASLGIGDTAVEELAVTGGNSAVLALAGLASAAAGVAILDVRRRLPS